MHDLPSGARIGWVLLAFALSACVASARPSADAPRSPDPAREPERPLATAAERPTCPADPDGDADGISDRCDACPFEPGMIWDDYPSIDGCATSTFHSLTREPEGGDPARGAAARAAKERAQREASPCGRLPGARTPPPPLCP
jgi:hypothetical protein